MSPCACLCKHPAARGFTLLELLLVILIMALAAALVIPDMRPHPAAGLERQAGRLQQVLRLALEEAELRGMPLRWSAFPDRYEFELADANGRWRRMREKPFQPVRLQNGVRIADVRLQDGLPRSGSVAAGSGVLAHIVLSPAGTPAAADIVLAAGVARLHLRLRPGPDGIHLANTGG